MAITSLLVSVIIRGLLANLGKGWWIVMIVVTTMGTIAQNPGALEAFDCYEPEDVIPQSIPESCTTETGKRENQRKS